MLKKHNPTETISWVKLEKHFRSIQDVHMKDLFEQDADRFDSFSVRYKDILLDYSKNRLTHETMQLLLDLAQELDLKDGIEQMYSGAQINETEERAVLHIALRQASDEPIYVDGTNVIPAIRAVQEKMKRFVSDFHKGLLKGYSHQPLKTVVNIGIGGSDLGPFMVTEALKPYWKEDIQTHFVSNIDAAHISEVLKKVKPEETLFIIASKSFTTQETMTNAYTARNWFLENGGTEETIEKHFIALSTNQKRVEDFGISSNNVFEFWDWVGGRYSLSSAIGLSIALTIGYDNFKELLDGLGDMDDHFRNTTFDQNLPVLLALIGIWYNNFYNAESEALLPYDQYLHKFPAYLQQGNMESNGKCIDRNGSRVDYQTGPIIWGEPGTNGQHAFYQLIHQGTKLVPCDFIAFAQSHNDKGDHHEKLLSNFFAQTEALMLGKTEEDLKLELEKKNISKKESKILVPFNIFEGNKPSNSILIKKLTPFTLGQLISMYEQKIFVQGYIWNIFSFDQWGVQLGKELAKKILPELKSTDHVAAHDSSTNGLINAYKSMR